MTDINNSPEVEQSSRRVKQNHKNKDKEYVKFTTEGL